MEEGKCQAGVDWKRVRPVRGHLENGEVFAALLGARRPGEYVWWSRCLGLVFRKFSYVVQLSALGGEAGLDCFSSEVGGNF